VKIIGDSLHSCELLREKIKTTLNQDAPVAIAKGMLLLGVNAELDELRAIYFREGILGRN
jgi:DNA mismatch repair protein MutS